MKLNIKDTFNKELPVDPILDNTRRQVTKACFSYVSPKQTKKPEVLHVSKEMASSLGISEEEINNSSLLEREAKHAKNRRSRFILDCNDEAEGCQELDPDEED